MSKDKKDDKPIDNSKYDHKPIKFFDKDDHYELYFVGEFEHDNDNNSVLADLLVDLKEANKDKELHIFINSYGGYVCTLTMLLTMVLRFKHRITVCTGVAMSCGLNLWACGHERYCTEFSDFLHHDMSELTWGKGVELKHTADELIELNRQVDKACGIDQIFTPEELKLAETSEVRLTGLTMITRGVAKSISEYDNRTIPSKKEVYEVDDKLYELKDNKYYKLTRSTTSITYNQLVHSKKSK